MAFENPFIKPSATRKSALQYLWSDEPTSSVQQAPSSSASFVDTFTSPNNASNTIGAIAVNILNNGGEYNADQGIDTSKPVDPFAAAIAFAKHGSAIKGAASLFGLGGFANVAQQQNANDIIAEMEKWGGVGADKSNVGLSLLGAGLSFFGVPLAGFISGESKDAVAAVNGLASQFETPEAMKGYFSAAGEQASLSKENFDGNGFLASMAGNLAKEDDINDFGQKAYELQNELNKGLSSGKDLGQVQQSLLDKYITPDTKLTYAIPAAVYSPALATATELGRLQESNKSLEQALADLQTGVAGQINTQGEQFQTLLDQYKELGMTQNEAIQQTINDLKTDIGSQISDVKSQVGSLNYATPDDIVNALAELNYVTPDDMAATLEGLNFTTPEDVTNQLAEAGFASTDDISNAIAGLNIPTVDDIISAIPTPVTETPLQPTTPLPPAGGIFDTPEPAPVVEYNPPEPVFDLGTTTSFQPANPDGSFVDPALNTPSIIGDLFPEYPTGGMLTSPVVGAPISTVVPTPTPLPSAGGLFDTPEPAPVVTYDPPTPTFDWGGSSDSGSSGGGYSDGYSSSGGGGYSSSSDGGWGSSNTGEW